MQAPRDENRIAVSLGTLDSDGVTPIPIRVDVTKGNSLCTLDGTTGTASTRTQASRDENRTTVWMGVSSVDMKTPVPIAIDINKNLLVQTT